MSDYPSSPAYSAPIPDAATGLARMEAQLETDRQGIFRGLQSLTISSGSITPADGESGSLEVDTQGAAATDDLTNIAQTAIPDGHAVILRIADDGRVVTVKHAAGGAGQIRLTGSLDLVMNRVGQRLLLERSGTDWLEVMRSGTELTHTPGAGGEPALQNSWTTPVTHVFWKDDRGVVRLRGALQNAVPPTDNSLIYTLPAGYRPAAARVYTVYATDNAVRKLLALQIASSGQVSLIMIPSGPPVGPVVLNVTEAVQFRAEA